MSSISGISPDANAAWREYHSKVRSRLRTILGRTKREGTLRLIVNRTVELQATFDDLEKSREFRAFVEAVRTTGAAAGYHKGGASSWENSIRNALRRSGYYSGVATGERINSNVVMRRLLRAFEPHDFTVTYLAPMEYVWLEAPRIACRTFTITKFTASELDKILETTICKLFYPWAVANTEILCSYWFIVVREKRSLQPLGKISIDLGSIGKVTPQYSPYPVLERAFQRLAMYDWLPDWAHNNTSQKGKKKEVDWEGWLGFKIPFVIRITDNILDSPRRVPNLGTLEVEPFFDPFTNEEIGERPSRHINLDGKQTQALQQCLISVDAMLGNVEPLPPGWSFMMRALGFLVKGFFTKGLEQLLWHITALESLFGEDRPGLTKLMARRISLVLGDTTSQKKEISNRFEELYNFRSKLVHGSELKSEVWEGHLKIARDFARRSLMWFLCFSREIRMAEKHSSFSTPPGRQEILAVIDSRPAAIIQLGKILKSVPKSFPAVRKWQEPF